MSTNEPGKLIDDAYEIIEQTYVEIGQMDNVFSRVIKEFDETLESCGEYSSATKLLSLKRLFLSHFKKDLGEAKIREFVGYIVLFSGNRGDHKKKTNVAGPEMWAFKLHMIKGANIYDIYDTLQTKYESNFQGPISLNKVISYDGKIRKHSVTGYFIGLPLIDVKNLKFIKEKILEPLYEHEII